MQNHLSSWAVQKQALGQILAVVAWPLLLVPKGQGCHFVWSRHLNPLPESAEASPLGGRAHLPPSKLNIADVTQTQPSAAPTPTSTRAIDEKQGHGDGWWVMTLQRQVWWCPGGSGSEGHPHHMLSAFSVFSKPVLLAVVLSSSERDPSNELILLKSARNNFHCLQIRTLSVVGISPHVLL